MGFAQILIQARGKRPAEDGVEHLQHVPVGRGARRPELTDPDHRLRGARFVDQIDRPRRGGRGTATGDLRHVAPLPRAEPRGHEPARLGQCDVADHEHAGGVGPVGGAIKPRDAIARQRGGGGVGAVERMPVGMSRPEHDRRERDVGHGDGLVPLLHQLRTPELPLPGHLRVGKRGPQHHVREQVERRLEPPPRRVQRRHGAVRRRRRGELRAEERRLVRHVERAACARPLLQHQRGERREPREVRRITRRPGVQEHLDVHHRHLVHLHHRERQAVGERRRLDRGQLERGRGRECGRPRAIDLGGQAVGRTGGQ